MDVIRKTDFNALKEMKFEFKDQRLETMLFRYRARNCFETLSDEEKNEWLEYRREILLGDDGHYNYNNFQSSMQTLESSKESHSDRNKDRNKRVLQQVKQYTDDLIQKL